MNSPLPTRIVRTLTGRGRTLSVFVVDGAARLVRDEGSPRNPVIWERGQKACDDTEAAIAAALRS